MYILFYFIKIMNLSAQKHTIAQETAEQRKFGRTYQQYYSDSRSRYRSPDSKSTSSQLSQTKVFDISINTLVAVINKIKQQNDFFTQQKERLSQEMAQLSTLSDMIIEQNQALRRHYQQRSVDIQQVIQSISLNWNEQLSDLHHLVYSFQGSNALLAKEIHKLNDQAIQIENNIEKLQKQFERINFDKINIEKTLRQAEIKSQQADRKIAKQKKQQTLADLQTLQKQVCDLSIEVYKIHKKNLSTLRYIRNERFHIQTQGPSLKNETIRTIQAKKSLLSQIQQTKDDCQKEQMKLSIMNENNQLLISQLNNLRRANESKNLKLGKLQNRIIQIEKQKQKSVQEIRRHNDSRVNKIRVKQDMEKQICLLQETKKKHITIFQMKKLEIESQAQKKIAQIKIQIQKTSENLISQIEKNFAPIKIQLDNTASGLIIQAHNLQSQVAQLQKLLKPNKISLRNVAITKKE